MEKKGVDALIKLNALLQCNAICEVTLMGRIVEKKDRRVVDMLVLIIREVRAPTPFSQPHRFI